MSGKKKEKEEKKTLSQLELAYGHLILRQVKAETDMSRENLKLSKKRRVSYIG